MVSPSEPAPKRVRDVLKDAAAQPCHRLAGTGDCSVETTCDPCSLRAIMADERVRLV